MIVLFSPFLFTQILQTVEKPNLKSHSVEWRFSTTSISVKYLSSGDNHNQLSTSSGDILDVLPIFKILNLHENIALDIINSFEPKKITFEDFKHNINFKQNTNSKTIVSPTVYQTRTSDTNRWDSLVQERRNQLNNREGNLRDFTTGNYNTRLPNGSYGAGMRGFRRF